MEANKDYLAHIVFYIAIAAVVITVTICGTYENMNDNCKVPSCKCSENVNLSGE